MVELDSSTDVVIIGGGIIGCATAYRLARRGMAVTLVDKGPI
ncbi:MAG: FAD-dependent oxidoreductase, partial [Chloroflexi bacterium]|nr:FAD-dependent oxidoreductase [Chloroflexota bacterium]